MNDNKALEALKVYGNGGNPDWLRTEAYDVVIAALVELAEIKKRAENAIYSLETADCMDNGRGAIAHCEAIKIVNAILKGEPK